MVKWPEIRYRIKMQTFAVSFLIFSLLFNSLFSYDLAFARTVPTKTQSPETFTPSLMTGLTIDLNNPLKLNFIMDLGDSNLDSKEFETEARKLIKYFLTALTVPEEELWVNLSPYEKNRIVPDKLGQTEMGQNLLGQDYLLKQLTVSLINPNVAVGRDFWKKVYDQAFKMYGKTDIPVNTFNRVWIVPDKAAIYEKWPTATIVDTHLKVLLEEDYLALKQENESKPRDAQELPQPQAQEMSKISSQIVREIIIPAIEKEVNEGKSFASLRQIYHSMILATWFKQKLKASLLGQIYVDQNKIKGIDSADKQINEIVYQQYLETFKKGVFNTVKEVYDPRSQEMIPRKYMAGGWSTRNPVDGLNLAQRIKFQTIDRDQSLSQVQKSRIANGHKKSVETALLENTSDTTIASAAASSTLEEETKIEKSILKVLEHKDRSSDELKNENIDDLVILGNDQLETFRETLRLFQRGIGKRIYISGGYGRLTLPLIDKAVEAGFKIRISEDQKIDAEDWQKIRAKNEETEIKKVVRQSQAEIIRQIMVSMIDSEVEFAELKVRFSVEDVRTVIVTERPQEKPENNSKNTFENLVLYKDFLIAEGQFGVNKSFKSLYIQTPHQQLRSKATVDQVFQNEISFGQFRGVSYTTSYQAENKSQEQIIKDLVGELWRLIMYSESGSLHLQSEAYPGGISSLPEDLWRQGLELFKQLPEDQKQKFAVNMLQLVSGFNLDLVNLSTHIPEEAKKFVQEIKTAEKIERKPIDAQEDFENEIKSTAQREGIVLTPDTKIGLFIGGPHIVGGYYYKLFADVVRNEFGVDLVYLPFPIEIGDQSRVNLVKEQLKSNPQIVGAVITRPWKEEFSDATSKIGAANFIVKDHATQQLTSTATDGQAWIDGLNYDFGRVYDFTGKKIVVVGSGGASRELAESLNAKGVAKISFADVDVGKSRGLEKLTADLKVDYQVEFLSPTENELNIAVQEADIVINATGIGREKTKGKSPLADKTSFHAGQIVCDLISNERTKFLKDAASRGVKHTFNGRSMFIYGMVGFMRGWLKQMGQENVPNESEMFASISDWLDNNDHSFANTLRNLRQRRDLSEVELAKMIHVSPIEIARWEAGMRFPQSKHFRELIRTLGEDLLLASEFTVVKEDSLGVAIKKLRRKKGLVQSKLAEKMGVDTSTVSRWETGVLDPSITDFETLIKILGDELLSINRFRAENQVTGESVAFASETQQEAEPFAVILKRLRVQLGLSQVELGKRIGVSEIAVFQWENGKRMPYPDNLSNLIKEFGNDLLLSRELRLNHEDLLSVAIQKLRLRKGLTQGELAERMRNGIDASNVSRWENNEYPPSLNDLTLLVSVLGEDLLRIDEFKAQKESLASSSAVDQNELKYGGINLNPRYLNLQIKRDGKGIPLPLIQQPINRMQIEGFVPIIINIVPINVPRLLSENKEEESQDMHLVNN